MADLTVDGLAELTTPAANDEIGIWDVSAGAFLKIRRDNLVGVNATGNGTIATGGFTLTVPATGTAALRDVANTFTANQTIGGYASPNLLISATTGFSHIRLHQSDNGAGTGNYIFLALNNNATTPAAGVIYMQNRAAIAHRLWVDSTGLLRIGTVDPTNANDGAGTVVGAQTSHALEKTITGPAPTVYEAFSAISKAAKQVQRFVYKDGRYQGETFSGLVLDGKELHRYGMDADVEHAAGRSLNVITLLGDLLVAVAALRERVELLEDM